MTRTHPAFLWTLLQLGLATAACGLGQAGPVADKAPQREFSEQDLSEQRETRKLSEMAYIHTGEFTMGSDRGEADAQPGHWIHLKKFYIDRYEVTQRRFQDVMKANPSRRSCDFCPVEMVTFAQAAEFCQKTGRRLPTEAEWERAARAGTMTWYYWGEDWEDHFGWIDANSGQKTHPAGQAAPNGFNLYDMAGNVAEWVSDWYDKNYYRISPLRSPKGPETGSKKIARGGSWRLPAEQARHHTRMGLDPSGSYPDVGFRCAADTPPPK